MKTKHPPTRTAGGAVRLGLLASLALLLGGCWQRSVHPFYTPGDVVTEPGLTGAWRQAPDRPDAPSDNRMAWTFKRVDDRRHDLVIVNDKERYEYEARAFRLGKDRFLDLFSKSRGVDTIPAHHLFRLVETGPSLKVAPLDPDWVAKWLRRNPGTLAHLRIASADNPDDPEKDEFVLTAETPALQGFLREHLADDGFFAEPIVFEKADAGDTPPARP